jgi:nucleoside-diphosphate-sugar epimerase
LFCSAATVPRAQPWPTDRPNNLKQARDKGLPPEWTLQANVMGTYHLLQGAVTHNVPVFVMTSSNCALGHGFRISWAWVGIEDVASAHRLLMERAAGIESHGVFFCNADDTSLLETTHDYLARFRPELLPLAAGLKGHAGFFSTRSLQQAVGWKHRSTWRLAADS